MRDWGLQKKVLSAASPLCPRRRQAHPEDPNAVASVASRDDMTLFRDKFCGHVADREREEKSGGET